MMQLNLVELNVLYNNILSIFTVNIVFKYHRPGINSDTHHREDNISIHQKRILL